jgi:hypothetical protein
LHYADQINNKLRAMHLGAPPKAHIGNVAQGAATAPIAAARAADLAPVIAELRAAGAMGYCGAPAMRAARVGCPAMMMLRCGSFHLLTPWLPKRPSVPAN